MKEEILGGLRNALAKGETLKYAMQSFYNAGYEKKDIEEAARELHEKIKPKPIQDDKVVQPVKQSNTEVVQPVKQYPPTQSPQKVSNYGQSQPTRQPVPNTEVVQPVKQYPTTQSPQKVSSYEQPKRNPRSVIVVILVILMSILIIVLGIIFLFKENLLEFFNNLFA